MEEITNLFDIILKIVHYLHIMPIRMKTKNIILFNIIGISYHFIFTFSFISMMCYYGFTDEDFEEKVISLNMTLTEISLFYKVLNMCFKRNDFYQILDEIKLFKTQNDNENNIIRTYSKKLKKAFYYYAIVTYLCIFLTVCVPLFKEDPYLPYKSWYPYNLKNKPKYFWILFIYQCIGLISHASLNVFNDSFIMFMLATIGIQLDIIGLRLKELNKSHESSLLNVMQNYDITIKLCEKFKCLMSSSIFIQIYLSSGVLCMATYHLSMV